MKIMRNDIKQDVSAGIKSLADVLRQTADAYEKLAEDLTDPDQQDKGESEKQPEPDPADAMRGLTIEQRNRLMEKNQ